MKMVKSTYPQSTSRSREELRQAPRIPFLVSKSFPGVPTSKLKKFTWRASLSEIGKNNVLLGGQSHEVLNLSPNGVAVLIDEQCLSAGDLPSTIITTKISNGNDKITYEFLGRICVDHDRSVDRAKDKGIVRISFLPVAGSEKQSDKIRKKIAYDKTFLKGYVKDSYFRKLIRRKIKMKRDESLHRYLDRVLRFMDSFINSDMGMVGYVVKNEEEKEVISVEDTVFIGHRMDTFQRLIINEKNREQPLQTLNKQKEDFDENRKQKNSCMAHSYESGKIYHIEYPPVGDDECCDDEYWSRHKNDWCDSDKFPSMKEEDRAAARQGKFNRIHENVLAEITVPIRPWIKFDYDKQERKKISNIFENLLNSELKRKLEKKGLLAFQGKYGEEDEFRDKALESAGKKTRIVLANDLCDKNRPRVLFSSGVSIKDSFWKALRGFDDYWLWKGIIDELKNKHNAKDKGVKNQVIAQLNKDKGVKNQVIALLNFELLKSGDGEEDEKRNEYFFAHGARDILQIIKEEVEIEIVSAIFDHYNSFRMVLYHTMITFLMGEPHHALNELGKWREVQLRQIFENFKYLGPIFTGYREFLTREAHFFSAHPPRVKDRDEKAYRQFLNIADPDKDAPDTRTDGLGGMGLFFTGDETNTSQLRLRMMQKYFLPTLHLHYILDEVERFKLRKGDAEDIARKRETFFKKARNIASRISPDIGKDSDLDAISKRELDGNLSEYMIKHLSLEDEVSKYIDQLCNGWLSPNASMKGFSNNLGGEGADTKWGLGCFQHRINENINEHLQLAASSIRFGNTDECLKNRRKYVANYLLHMRFLIGIAQVHHVIRNRELSPEMTFSDFEILDKNTGKFLQNFIATCSLLILSESVLSESAFPEEDAKNGKKPSLTVPQVMAYLYRAKAFLLLGQNQNAYNDYSRLERLIETRPDNFKMTPQKPSQPCFWLPQERAEAFENWLKAFINHQKGVVYFASFAKQQSLVSFCHSMEKLTEFNDEYAKAPRITTIESMMYKGKAFFERGSYSRSLKWYFKAVYETIQHLECWWESEKYPQEVWTPFQLALMEELIELMEKFKHNAIIDKAELVEKLVLRVYRTDEERLSTPKSDFTDGELLEALMRDRVVNKLDNNARDVRFDDSIKSEAGLIDRLQVSESTETESGDDQEPNEKRVYTQEEINQTIEVWQYSSRFLKLCSIARERARKDPLAQLNGAKDDDNPDTPYNAKKILEKIKPATFDSDRHKIRVSDCLFPDRSARACVQEQDIGAELARSLVEEEFLKDEGDEEPKLHFVERSYANENELESKLKELSQDDKPLSEDAMKKILAAWRPTVAFRPMARLLSDILNRIGFLLFDLRLFPDFSKPDNSGKRRIQETLKIGETIDESGETKDVLIDLALDWVERSHALDPNNGFAKFNQLLIKGEHEEKDESEAEDFSEAFENLKHTHRKFYPILLHWMKQWLGDKKKDSLKPDDRFYYGLLKYQLRYIDDFVRKPAESYAYLTKERTISLPDDDEPLDGLYFLGRYSSWSPKLPRPRVFSINGGGKFLVWKKKGILIDPGFDLLNNLYAEGFSLEDIDAVIITHDHHDHTEDFESMWRLIKEHNEVIKHSSLDEDARENRMIRFTLFTNLGFQAKCSRFLSSDSNSTYVERVYPLSKDTTLSPKGFSFDIIVIDAKHSEVSTKDYPIGFILNLKEKENGESGERARNAQDTVLEIGFTSDTRFHKGIEAFYDCDVVVPHICNAAFRELKAKLKFDALLDVDGEPVHKKLERENEKDGEKVRDDDGRYYIKLFRELDRSAKESDRTTVDMTSILQWSFWYRDEDWVAKWLKGENDVQVSLPGITPKKIVALCDNKGKGSEWLESLGKYFGIYLEAQNDVYDMILRYKDIAAYRTDVLDGEAMPEKTPLKEEKILLKWGKENDVGGIGAFFETVRDNLSPGVLRSHLGASGIYRIWDGMREATKEKDLEKLLILSEFREEMGSFRNKVAYLLNREFEKIKKDPEHKGKLQCFTSDIGMAVRFSPSGDGQSYKTSIQCSICSGDNDLLAPRKGRERSTRPYPEATFHPPDDITEVCIKGDAERMVYLCRRHVTGPDALFIEQLDRFDLFSSKGISL